MQMRAGLLVNDDTIGTRIPERGEMPLGFFNHQMHIQEYLRTVTKSFYHVRSKGNRRNVATIHDINVQPVRSRGNHTINLIPKPRDIRGKDRRGYED
jgi:hypothetical protein